MGTSSAQNEAEAAELREAADEAVDAREAAEAAAATREPSGVIAVGSTMSSVAPSSAGSSSHTNGNVAGLKMQLEDANRDAEDLRRYNAFMRREHAATLADLEEELEGERSSKTDPLGQIVELQYRIATLEGDLEEARAGRGRDRKNILAEMEGEVVNRVEGELRSLKDQLRQKLSEAEKSRRMLDEMKDGMKDRERALRDKLRARSDEAEATKRSLDKAREEASARETSLKTQLRARDAEL